MARTLIEQYNELIEAYVPEDVSPGEIHTLDQNIAILRSFAEELGLNLDDPLTLQTVVRAQILCLAFTIAHIAGSCDNTACHIAAVKHTQIAAGQLGGHFMEIQRNLP